MQSISDIIQALARQRGRTDGSPLALLRSLDGARGDRITHLPVSVELAQAWQAMTGEPSQPHQAQALMAMRRGEAVALRADSAAVNVTAALLIYAAIAAEPGGSALLVTPDELAGRVLHAELAHLDAQLPAGLRLSAELVEPARRVDATARVLIASAEMVHARMLRHHDRAWRVFWSRLTLLALPDIHRYTGVAGAHMADLLLRIQRVGAHHSGGAPLAVLATLLALGQPEAALAGLLGQGWRIISADDGPRSETLLAVWRGGAAWLRDAADIAIELQRNEYRVHILCGELERAALAPIVGDLPAVTLGPDAWPADALVVAGFPGSHSALRRLLRSGYHAVALVLGDLPHERAIARQPDSLLAAPPTAWPHAPANAYVAAQHVLCAASELPLTADEVEIWGAQEIVERLAAGDQLVDLPDPEVAWKPGPQAGDPYVDFNLLAASGGAVLAQSEQGAPIAALDPTGFERWTFPGAALPPGAGGLRVVARDEESGSVTLRIEANGRRTYPLRRCTVTIRETRETRRLAAGPALSLGRVVLEEEIYGYREMVPGSQPEDRGLKPPLRTRWIATACWFDLTAGVQVMGQLIGWSLAAALPLRALASIADLVPAYDHERGQLFFIDSQPGGTGLAAWLFAHVEDLLPLAYDVAYACRNDPLFEPLSRVDMDWLLALLGRVAPAQPAAEPPRPAPEPPPAPRQAPSAAPPEEPPRRVVQTPLIPPAPQPAERPPAPPEPRRGSERRPARQEPPPREPERRPSRPEPPREPERRPSRQEPPRREPERPAPPPRRREPERQQAPPEEDGPPDAAALIDRLRRQREQRESAQARSAPRPQRGTGSAGPVLLRFKPGDKIFCMPYGDGVVRESRAEGGRELLTVTFAEHGDLEIDPALSLVRKLEDDKVVDDDLL